ncbi:biotin/lipoyl-containing protein, partial [Microbacterium suaedae]|uniref:biotin/lipoyl-containing protein n=2 Tax=Microbacterium suaedae TaxID=2067813 RepID=UPI0030B84A7C
MSTSVVLPALGESVTEGTVTRWLKQVGDTVEVDEPLLEVSTDKVDTEIPSPVAGVLEAILVQEDETAEVGADLATVGDGAASSAAEAPAAPAAEAPAAEAPEEPAPEAPAAPAAAPADSGDATDVTLPELGESVTEGTITRWLKQVGDTVDVDEPLLEISTDKVDTEVPSPVAGTVLELLAGEDDTVDVGAVLARVGSGAPASQAPAAEAPAAEAPAEPAPEAPAAPAAAPADSGDATDVTLPELGESVTEGTITRWLKQVGDTVDVDEPLLEISTDKVDTEVPSPVAGTVLELLAGEDDTVDVGAVLARVGSGAPASQAPAAEAPAAEAP